MPAANWSVLVFESNESAAFAVPDGSLFVSDSLVRQTNDAELTALVAHLMGHVRYAHYQLDMPADLYAEANPPPDQSVPEPQSAFTCAWRMPALGLLDPLRFAAAAGPLGLLGFAFGTLFAPLDVIMHKKELCNPKVAMNMDRQWRVFFTPRTNANSNKGASYKPPDERFEELQANYAAAGYLAQIRVASSVLFNTMARIKMSPSSNIIPWPPQKPATDFGAMEFHADNGAADLGRMLDAGLIPGQ